MNEHGHPARGQHHPGACAGFDACPAQLREHTRVDHGLDVFLGSSCMFGPLRRPVTSVLLLAMR